MWEPLFANLAFTAIALVSWGAFSDLVTRLSPGRQRLAFGGAMAIGAVGSMMMAFEAAPGVFYDLRGPLIAVSCFFGGPVAGFVVAGAAAAYRVYLGGSVGTGLLGIAVTTIIGLIGHASRRKRAIRNSDVFVLSMLVAVSGSLIVFTLPAAVRDRLLPLMWAPFALSFICTLLLGMLLLRDRRHREILSVNRLYRSMVDILPDCLNIKDIEGRFLAANPATADLMQAGSAEALIGRTDFDFYPLEVAARFRQDELAIFATGEITSIEQQCVRGDGSHGWLSTLKVPIRGDDGSVVGLITHNRDISSAKTLQARLEETQSYLDQALDNMNDGLVMLDAAGVIVFCNDRYRELFPMTAHLRVSGTPFAEILRCSVACGEEVVEEGDTIEAHISRKVAGLRESGETLIEIADGRTFAVRTKILANGHCLRMIADVTARLSFERHLEYQAQHDPLTGLANRSLFNRQLSAWLEVARSKGGALTVMMLDLDHFKPVNDSLGHAAGDALLVEVSRRLEASVRPGDLVARLGGDEFVIVMKDLRDDIAEISMARRISKAIAMPFAIGDVMMTPSATIGYTAFPRDPSEAEGLLRNADGALYRAKRNGRGGWKAYAPAETAGAPPRAGSLRRS